MNEIINDIELIAALHRGEAAAYESVYVKFARPLRFFIGQVVTDDMAAEDIMVETLTKAFTKNQHFPSVEKLKAFLFVTAANASLDFIRKRTRNEQAHQEIKYLSEGEMTDVELAYLTTEATRAVYTAIEALPDRPRQVITMAFLEGKKLPQIAQELNISYNTVQEYRARGLQMLRVRLVNNKLPAVVLAIALSLLERQ